MKTDNIRGSESATFDSSVLPIPLDGRHKVGELLRLFWPISSPFI